MDKELLKNATDAIKAVVDFGVTSEDVGFDLDDIWHRLADECLKMEREPASIADFFDEWNALIKKIDENSRKIFEIDEQYKELSKTVLQEAIEKDVDFKAIYGGNTEKTRKQYVDEQLKSLLDEKKDLEFEKSDGLRRIDYIKSLMKMQGVLIEAGVAE